MHGDMHIADWFPTAIVVLAVLIFLGTLAVSIRAPVKGAMDNHTNRP